MITLDLQKDDLLEQTLRLTLSPKAYGYLMRNHEVLRVLHPHIPLHVSVERLMDFFQMVENDLEAESCGTRPL